MSSYFTDNRVDDYIDSLPGWQRAFAQQVRDIAHEAAPDVAETIKRSVLPYFVLDGNICAFMGTKDHLNVLIYDPIAPDPQKIINQGHGNKTARTIQIYEGETLNKEALLALFKAVIANNRAGGWRTVAKNQNNVV